MKIETKANIGNKIFYLQDNKVCNSYVQSVQIAITSYPGEVFIQYLVSHGNLIEEKNIFTSIKDLASAIEYGEL